MQVSEELRILNVFNELSFDIVNHSMCCVGDKSNDETVSTIVPQDMHTARLFYIMYLELISPLGRNGPL